MLFQTGEDNDYMPKNESFNEANDDQSFWAFAALSAAELKFPNPDPSQPQWLALAQAVFNRIAFRWDAATCDGGFRWQYNPTLNGYDYKNAISNGAFFQIGARLARYTQNDTYASWAEKTWEWVLQSPIIEGDENSGYTIWDGVNIPGGCTKVNKGRFSYNWGTFITGSAYLYSYYKEKGDSQAEMEKWLGYTKGLVLGANQLFPKNDVLSEVQCEDSHTCDYDSSSFKAYTIRWLTTVALLVDDDDMKQQIFDKLAASASAAGQACTGAGPFGNTEACGVQWNQDTFDDQPGVGQQMAAMSVFANNLVKFVGPVSESGGSTSNDNGKGTPIVPLSQGSGATSEGNPSAGTGDGINLAPLTPITTGDRAGAGILTTLVLGGTVYLAYFLTFAKD
jgi:mannan endo-1,6-alpha-mannosidase